jgi:putative flippase GtrA
MSTAVDYSVMIAVVEILHVGPVVATVVAAASGAVANFVISRRFTFRAAGTAVSPQVWRFALVSGTSLGLNALGEHVFHNLLGLQYVLARVITSVIVNNGWNYPMLRFFVFSSRRPPSHA